MEIKFKKIYFHGDFEMSLFVKNSANFVLEDGVASRTEQFDYVCDFTIEFVDVNWID